MLADSGVQRGSDILKLLLAGADAVMLGRAMLYALAAAGTEGAVRMVELLSAELSDCRLILGAQAIACRSLP